MHTDGSTLDPIRILISAGEVSGDIAGAQLVAAIRRARPAIFHGLGGHRMAEAGVNLCLDTNSLGTVGITEAFVTLPKLLKGFFRLRREVRTCKPNVAVLIGNDVFNFFLARWLRFRGIPTVAFFPPQIWVWRSLARIISGSFDLILTSFPEEQEVYKTAGGPAHFIGHYLCGVLASATPREKLEARRRHNISPGGRVVALLPGSRDKEITRLAPTLLSSARRLLQRDPALKFLLPAAEPCFEEFIRKEIERYSLAGSVILTQNSHEAMRASDLALLASGTATLEAALLGIPMIVLYRVSFVTLLIIKVALRCGLLRSETVALPNLILREPCVPELRQDRATAGKLAELAWSMLSDQTRLARIQKQLDTVASLIESKDCLESAASLIVQQASRADRSGCRQGVAQREGTSPVYKRV